MTQNFKISLNGIFINGRIDGVDDFKITLRRKDEDGKLVKSYSSELTFYDDGYDILKAALIDPINGFNEKVIVKVYDDCCAKEVYEGIIMGDAIDWCYPLCQIKANITEPESVLDCLETVPIYDNRKGFLNKQYYAVRYCLEHRPLFMQVLSSFLAVVLEIVMNFVAGALMVVLIPLFAVMYLICEAVNLLSRKVTQADCDKLSDTYNPIDIWKDLVKAMFEWIVPCGSFHPSAYVRDYINNVCDICGVNFKSSILNDWGGPYREYFALMLVSAPIKRGRHYDNTDFSLIQENLPLETLDTLMNDHLKPMFNADYWLVGNDLVFERKDHVFSNAIWIDADYLLQQGFIERDVICYNWIKKERWAYGRYEYAPDAIEYIGNEAKERYADIIDWNTPRPTLAQKKEYKNILPSSMTRVLTDGIDDTFLSIIRGYGILFNTIFQFGGPSLYAQKSDIMITAQHNFFNYKFIIGNDDGNRNIYVKGDYPDSYLGGNTRGFGGPTERYNYPLWFQENLQNNLYTNFHYIDNPRLASAQQFEYSFEFRFDCVHLADFDYHKTIKMTRNGIVKYGTIDEAVIDFNKRTISVKGKVN